MCVKLQAVDAFVCTSPLSVCEAFLPFNKSILLLASRRMEIGRSDPTRWQAWINSMRVIAADKRNVVAANNMFDVAYIRYFTGLQEVLYLPSFCGSASSTHQPAAAAAAAAAAGNVIAVGTSGQQPAGVVELTATIVTHLSQAGLTTHNFPLKFNNGYQVSDLAKYSAFVLVPSQVSFALFFELYRLGVPLFAPSKELWAGWQVQHSVLQPQEGSWLARLTITGGTGSALPSSACAKDSLPFDPNSQEERSLLWWLALSDLYTFPHIVYFNSVAELSDKLAKTDLAKVSSLMHQHNQQQHTQIQQQWKSVMHRMFDGLAPTERTVPSHLSFSAALSALYGEDAAEMCN